MISIIVAMAQNDVIGGENKLLWHISEDLRRFKAITTGHPVIMGRKTFESIGRPLPNRTNIIISRNSNYKAEGCTVVGSLEEAIGIFPATEEVFIIGGGQIYAQAMALADKLYLTVVHRDYRGDTLFPKIDESWCEVSVEYHERSEKFPYPFEFITYQRADK